MNPLSWLEDTTSQTAKSIEKLPGLSACSYLVTLDGGGRYVLRSQTPRATSLGINYQQESAVLNTIQPIALAPNVLFSHHFGTILDWQEGNVPSDYSNEILSKLAEQLARLHLFAFYKRVQASEIARLDLVQRCQFLWSHIVPEKRAIAPSPDIRRIEPFAQAICHHDIHRGNLVETADKLCLIDWEYAAISDPALDIALFLHSDALTAVQSEYFLDHYLQHTQFDRPNFEAKMAEYVPAIETLNALWALI